MNMQSNYYSGINLHLAQCVDSREKTILEIGCGEGRLGGFLKQSDPQRSIYGIELVPEIADRARKNLDEVFNIDVLDIDSVLGGQKFDLILAGDVLEHLVDPENVLIKLKSHLRPNARILACVPNVQHVSMLQAVVSGNWNYRDEGLLDKTHLRFFSRSSFMKLCLDAGLEPVHIRDINTPLNAPGNAIQYLAQMFPGLHPKQLLARLAAYQMIFQATLPRETIVNQHGDHTAGSNSDTKISFIVCVNSEHVFLENFAMSPCVRAGTHEVLKICDATSASDGLTRGMAMASHDLIAFVHQDIYLPREWDTKVTQQYKKLLAETPNLGALGVYGVANHDNDDGPIRCGRVVDSNLCIYEEPQLPREVNSLDEIVIMLRKNSGLGFDPALGFHLYGSDICLQARTKGLRNFVLYAPCYHATQTVGLDEKFHQSAELFRQKWHKQLPKTYQTPCFLFT